MSNEKRLQQIRDAARYKYPDERIHFIDGAKWADQHPAWVSVEEELPEENTAPLVRMDLTEKFGEETILYDVVVFDRNGFNTPYKVTHWMQITPPVKKGGQDAR